MEPVALTLEESGLAARAVAGRQPPGAKYPRLIPEFRDVTEVDIPAVMAQDLGLSKGAQLICRACQALSLPDIPRSYPPRRLKGGRFWWSGAFPSRYPNSTDRLLISSTRLTHRGYTITTSHTPCSSCSPWGRSRSRRRGIRSSATTCAELLA